MEKEKTTLALSFWASAFITPRQQPMQAHVFEELAKLYQPFAKSEIPM